MAEQTQVKAFEGGDTHPDVASAIHERNKVMQELTDAQRAHADEKKKNEKELYEKGQEAQRKLHADLPALSHGLAVGEPDRPVVGGHSAATEPPATPKQKPKSD